jgi:hypothetical protein
MVRDDTGQLYTIEGFAAALIMILTAFLVVNATSVYTAGDTHINDMQLEALGSDALKMMGTPVNSSMNKIDNNPLQTIIENNDTSTFKSMFLVYINRSGLGPLHNIQFNTSYSCRIYPGTNITSVPFGESRNLSGGEHTVRATKWVIVDATKVQANCGTTPTSEPYRAVLVEVLLWRD